MEKLSEKSSIWQSFKDIGLQRILAPAALVILYIF